ncbi:MAG: glycoside hydrolase family 1 protein [Anaerolineales bacterium]|nr:MAG: glycoside hydrolase family 1 protein [Anaerolineales bacterium]
MIAASYQFPPGFLWGTATAAHQVEGNNVHNDWWAWEQQADRILHGQQSGLACDWWGGRWQEDFDRAAQTHQNTHRLSIEWSRIEPEPALWDESAIEGYREILSGLIERGMVPMVTLHHFTTPQWVQERGGWLSEQVITWFERYVRKVVEAMHDLVSLWITVNEPNVLAYAAYADGSFPPGRSSLQETAQVVANLVKAHAAAYHAIHAIRPDAAVGMAHQFRGFRAGRRNLRLNQFVADFRHRTFNHSIPQAVTSGKLNFLRWKFQIPEARGTQDFMGLNYYTEEEIQFDLFHPGNALKPGGYGEDVDLSPTGFIANKPLGFWEAMRWAKSFDLPIYITENGIEDEQDLIRPRYMASHIHQLWKALNFNWDIRGYYHWSLVDNFEWERGWSQRFGLWEIDPKTQARTKRRSADFYAEICQQNALTSEAVSRFAPEVHAELFPPKPGLDLSL